MEDLSFYIAQSISVIAGILAIIMMQLKNMKSILLFEIIVNLVGSLNYLLLGGNSGAVISLLAIVQTVVMYIFTLKKKEPHISVIVLFILAYLGGSLYNIISSAKLIEILPALAAICFALSVIQKKPSLFRIWGTLNPLFWMPYDIITRSYVMFIVHFGIFTSSLIGMIRYDGFLRIVKKEKIGKTEV